jgi:acyl-CoA synthetase (AMP-forming)/AMP-acid ligase II
MTEVSPPGTFAAPTARIAKLGGEEQLKYALKQGRPPIGVELELLDDDGVRLPHDGTTFGRLMVRGPFVVERYFKGRSSTRASSTPATLRLSTAMASCRSPIGPRTSSSPGGMDLLHRD